MLTPTPRGKSALERAVRIATPIALAMWKGVSEKERKTLAAIVNKILKNLDQMGPDQNNFNLNF
jgi:DNA-binding MarR family transcriptional regulator